MKFLFLLFPLFVLSQEQTAKGLILDKETNEPIPYVNILILESEIGTSSVEDGSYSLTIQDDNLNKVVKLSALGYKSSKIPVALFLNAGEVFLEPLVEQLDEVIVYKKFEEEFLEINPIKKKEVVGGLGGMKEHPHIYALHLPYDTLYSNTEYISKVKIFLNKTSLLGGSKSMASKFRLRIFTIGTDSLPESDLISKNIIVETSKKQREIEIDLSEFNLVFPEQGIFVGVEWLHIPANAYKFTYTKMNSKRKHIETRYAPRVSMVKRTGTKNNLAIYSIGKWYAVPIPSVKEDEYFIPAISLTLSN